MMKRESKTERELREQWVWRGEECRDDSKNKQRGEKKYQRTILNLKYSANTESYGPLLAFYPSSNKLVLFANCCSRSDCIHPVRVHVYEIHRTARVLYSIWKRFIVGFLHVYCIFCQQSIVNNFHFKLNTITVAREGESSLFRFPLENPRLQIISLLPLFGIRNMEIFCLFTRHQV